jgi:hypothetical protein
MLIIQVLFFIVLMYKPEKRASTIDLLQHPKIREYAQALITLPQSYVFPKG